MRKLPIVLLLVCLATFAHGEIKPVGDPIEIAVTGKTSSHAVFYSGGSDKTVASITPIGPFAQNDGIALQDGPGPTPETRSVRITVTPDDRRLEYGKSYSGALILTDVDGTTRKHLGQIPVKITFAAPAIAIDAVHADLCVTCAGPHVVPVRVRNAGMTTVTRLHIGPLVLHARGYEWVVPAPNKKTEKENEEEGQGGASGDGVPGSGTTGTGTATDTAGSVDENQKTESSAVKITARPGSDVALTLQPAESRVIYVAYDPPSRAGDYAGSIEISAPGVDAVKTAVTLRSRGPWIRVGAPLVLFLLVLVIAILQATWLENYFGSGKGLVRDDALVSLEDTLTRLREVEKWLAQFDAPKKLLPNTHRLVAFNIAEAGRVIANAKQILPDALKDAASMYADAVAKRELLQDVVSSANDPSAAAPKVDGVPIPDSLAEYRKALEAALSSAAEANQAILPTPLPPVMTWPRRRRRWFQYLRRIAVVAVSIVTAFLALYYDKCAFGTFADYAQTFFWGLGVTAAGNALVREGNTQYKREGET